MKAIVKPVSEKIQNLSTPFLIKNNNVDIKIIDFQKIHKYHVLELDILNLTEDNYRVFIKGNYLTVIVSEPKEIKRPVRVHNMNWNINSQANYEVMKNVDIWLPGNNFYLIKHYTVPESQLLTIILGRMHMN
jgi:hypothetical protein